MYTQDYTSKFVDLWANLVEQLPPIKCMIEIGSYEGRSSSWWLENGIADEGVLHCIDSWQNTAVDLTGKPSESESAYSCDGYARFETFKAAMQKAQERNPGKAVKVFRGSSYLVLSNLAVELAGSVDFIYVDGCHAAPEVLADAVQSFGLLRLGGVLLFDDYGWPHNTHKPLEHPKTAIDSFINVFADRVHVVHKGYQLAVQRTA